MLSHCLTSALIRVIVIAAKKAARLRLNQQCDSALKVADAVRLLGQAVRSDLHDHVEFGHRLPWGLEDSSGDHSSRTVAAEDILTCSLGKASPCQARVRTFSHFATLPCVIEGLSCGIGTMQVPGGRAGGPAPLQKYLTVTDVKHQASCGPAESRRAVSAVR